MGGPQYGHTLRGTVRRAPRRGVRRNSVVRTSRNPMATRRSSPSSRRSSAAGNVAAVKISSARAVTRPRSRRVRPRLAASNTVLIESLLRQQLACRLAQPNRLSIGRRSTIAAACARRRAVRSASSNSCRRFFAFAFLRRRRLPLRRRRRWEAFVSAGANIPIVQRRSQL